MSVDVLHITHTDVRTDSRILKEINCLSSCGYSVAAAGIEFDEGGRGGYICPNIDLITLIVKSNKLRAISYVPRLLIYFMIVLEITLKMYSAIRDLKPKIIHCHDTLVLPVGYIYKIFNDCKLVYDAHELESNKNGTTKVGGFLTFLVEYLIWPKIDAFITVSHAIRDWYSSKLCSKLLSEVIFNSPILNESAPSNTSYLREKYSIPASSNIFIYVGILGEGRFIDELLKVFQSQKISSHIVFLGYGSLVSSIQEASVLSEKIHYHEAVRHDEMLPIISSANFGLCLLPDVSLSDFYCLPNKFFEYVFAGVPVLSSKLPEIERVIREKRLGVSTDLSVEAVESAILKLEDGCDVSNFDRANIYEFSWEAQQIKLNDMYSKMFK
ncbi:glycosyltransferase [Cellvibrio sp.]|uniref:glycosyltransferase n=1 Tax=Cellvibrio sp. TaxID=1965322 RepID=UPI0039647E35